MFWKVGDDESEVKEKLTNQMIRFGRWVIPDDVIFCEEIDSKFPHKEAHSLVGSESEARLNKPPKKMFALKPNLLRHASMPA